METIKLTPDDEKVFHQILDYYVNAWNNRDINLWSTLFSNDVDYVNRGGGWWKSNEENIEGHRKIFEKIQDAPRTYRAQVEKIAMLKSGLALVHVRWYWPGVEGSDNKEEVFNGIMTLVLIKGGNEWKIRSVHNTVVG